MTLVTPPTAAIQAALPRLNITAAAFGAVVGSILIDNRAALQAALNTANALGGGIVYIPPGRFRCADTGATLTYYSNTIIEGDGESSVLFFDDTATNPRCDLFAGQNVSNVAFRDFAIEGTALTYTNGTNASHALTGTNVTNLSVSGVSIRKCRFFACAFGQVQNANFTRNTLEYIVSDGIHLENSWNVVVTGNIFRRVSDDAVALHSDDTQTLVGSGYVVADNVFEECQGIKVAGGKTLSITGNVMRRMIRGPIDVELTGSGSEGNSPVFSIDISDNIIEDTLTVAGGNAVIIVGMNQALSASSGTLYPGINQAPYAYDYRNNVDAVSGGLPPAAGIRVHNNTISRSLPSGSNYSAWGYGVYFDRNVTNYQSDFAVTEGNFALHGIVINAPISDVSVKHNIISGLGVGYGGVLINCTGTANRLDVRNLDIAGNTFRDCPGFGIWCSFTGSGTGAKNIRAYDNIFDLDPYFRHPQHNADNTWSGTGCSGFYAPNAIAIVTGNNVFKNVANTGLDLGWTHTTTPNIVYSSFVDGAVGDNVANKGVRVLPNARTNSIIPIDGDPTSTTYEQALNTPASHSSAIPTTGRYVQGHFVSNSVPTVITTGTGSYTVIGWSRLTTGGAHVLGTDWAEIRSNSISTVGMTLSGNLTAASIGATGGFSAMNGTDGQFGVGGDTAGNAYLGKPSRSANGSPYFDFFTYAGSASSAVRMQCYGGTGAFGSGAMTITAASIILPGITTSGLYSSGAVVTPSGVTVRNGADGQISMGGDSGNGSLAIGKNGRSTAGAPYVDFFSSTGGAGYDVRLTASGGNSTVGKGTLSIFADVATFYGSIVNFNGIPRLPSYTVATLPTASAANANGMVSVSNGSSNRRLAVSDGSNWRWGDGTIVS